ncbi:50S ribosomal protein L31 [Shimazuella alba]|jgi:large subunit ribosomal protein L31|uniref:Large ribosomal subunit protein bL31 n=1 Tax=Shimazuella alba TaxID=2690964 RepID=A0A6I4VPI5_9BACL|nr:50S ribosomal protein L31 [Shimazuella alba]MXQ52973.1 50S ribosomal protein L31 [Shimazuella alba]
MKAAIHPNYKTATVTCMSCGTTFETGSTAEELKVDVCSKCHPFYTGKQRMVNAGGRVDRFKKKYKID